MNLAVVLLAWNLARQQSGLRALAISPALTAMADRQLSGWQPGTDPEPAYSSAGMVAVIWRGAETPAAEAQALLAAPYHRSVILGGYTTEGVAAVSRGDWHALLAMFGGFTAHRPPYVLWLPDVVPGAWTDTEYPSPFGLPIGAVTGWPILVRTTLIEGWATDARLVGANGVPVPAWIDADFNLSGSLLLLPRAPLPPGRYQFSFVWHPLGAPERVVRPFEVAS